MMYPMLGEDIEIEVKQFLKLYTGPKYCIFLDLLLRLGLMLGLLVGGIAIGYHLRSDEECKTKLATCETG